MYELNFIVELLVCFFLLVGGFFTLAGSIGLYRFKNFYMRLHAPTKATTCGVGGILIASMLYFSVGEGVLSVHELLITLFLVLTAPVSAHMLALSAKRRRIR